MEDPPPPMEGLTFMCGYGPSRVFKVKPKKTLLIRNLKMGKIGEVAERLNAAVLKTVLGNTNGGSNPSLSANARFD